VGTFTYDGAGNVVEDTSAGDSVMDRRKLTYDSGQRITSIHRGAVTADLTYGPLGRIATTVTGPSLRQVWSFGSLVEKRIRADGRAQLERRIPGPLGVIASLRHDDSERAIVYTHGDERGNRFFTDGDGYVVQNTTYAPYGRVTSDDGAGAALTYTDDLWNGGDDLRELGVVLLGPRAYDPAIGRFLQRDPLIHAGSSSTGNPYSFAFGDPINLSDPSGLGPECGNCPSTGVPVSFGAPPRSASRCSPAPSATPTAPRPRAPRQPSRASTPEQSSQRGMAMPPGKQRTLWYARKKRKRCYTRLE
jgi:RHS repeat-associated protein